MGGIFFTLPILCMVIYLTVARNKEQPKGTLKQDRSTQTEPVIILENEWVL